MKDKKNDVNIFNFPAKKYSSWIFDETLKYQKKYNFEIGTGKHATWNNEADAFKHTFMQAHLSLLFGKNVAKYVGDWHENDGNIKMGQSFNEYNMDNWNNAQGREIAKEIIRENGILATIPNEKINDIIAEKVMEKMRKGELITNPNDERKYDGFWEKNFNKSTLIDENGNPTGFAASVYTPEQIGKMSIEEYMNNEEEILSQYEKGLIKNKEEEKDYSMYTNPISGKKRVFTREDIDKMLVEEFTKHEKEIFAQTEEIGVPYKNNISKNTITYTKDKNYYSSKNGKWVTIDGNHVFIEND